MYAIIDEYRVALSPSLCIEVGDKVRASLEKICVWVLDEGKLRRERGEERGEREIRDLKR